MSSSTNARGGCVGRSSLGNTIRDWIYGYRTVRVAVIGGKECGKTVFLTALANHLQSHDSQRFPIGVEVDWDSSENQQDTLHGIPRFPYGVARERLGRGEWPDKTFSESLLAMRLNLTHSDGRRESVQLELLDIPGERVADFVMIGYTYAEWCKWMQERFAGPDGKNAAYREYLERAARLKDDETALFDAYRDFLAEEFAAFSPLITPSTVKLGIGGKEGDLLRANDPASFRAAISSVPIGFKDENDEVTEFVPLPKKCLDDAAWSGFVSRYSAAYEKYKAKVLLPTKKWLEGSWRTPGARKLFYLVDVLNLLQEGEEAWNAQRECGEAIIGMLCPRRPYDPWRRGWEWLKGMLWKTKIDTVYIVATKSDRVCSDQRDNLKNLAKDLLGGALKKLDDGVTHDVLSCAAVCSTQEVNVDDQRGLQGWIFDSRNGGTRQSGASEPWIPSNVPPKPPSSAAEWKEMQRNGDFNYPSVFPGYAFSMGQGRPPQYLGLNTLIKETLG